MIPGTPLPAPGPRTPALLLALLIAAAQGLRVLPAPDTNCSLPGLQCTVLDSNCFDLSWLHPYDWTPAAPSEMTVTVASELNERGQTVPVLQITWTVRDDASIKTLQGAEILIFEESTSSTRCVQLQFGNEFPRQRDWQGQPWRFSFDKFQVDPGNGYTVTVQHLPRNGEENSWSRRIMVPNCTHRDLMLTYPCCQQGYCWRPNISLEIGADEVIVGFSPLSDATDYYVRVHRRDILIFWQWEPQPQGAPSDRIQVTFPSAGTYEECLYSIEVWPELPDCKSDCVRKKYRPPCSPVTPVPAHPDLAVSRRSYLWAIAASVTVLVFSAIVLVLYYFHDSIYTPGLKPRLAPPDPPQPPKPTKRKVWLVYSADHERYVSAVIKLADYLRVTWAMDVIVDRLHVQDIGRMGAMNWLGRQKQDIEEDNGTILVLCSRGAQEKWEAMKNRQEPRVTLRSDARHPLGDLFTPALALILPDFQRARPYDRYVVAYFSQVSHPGHIPSPLEICPKYPLTENLQALFFRIQRFEQYQPNFQFAVGGGNSATYGHLMAAIERCQAWQERHPQWFEKESSPDQQGEAESSEDEDEEVGGACRVVPLIRDPETPVSLVNPIIITPDPVLSVHPKMAVAPPVGHVDPLLRDPVSAVSVLQPLLTEPADVLVLQPSLAAAMSLPEFSRPLLERDGSAPPDRGFAPVDFLKEAQKQLFYQSVAQERETPNMELAPAAPCDLCVTPQSGHLEGPCEAQDMAIALQPYKEHPPPSGDQGYYTWKPNRAEIRALQENSVQLFLQNGGLLDYS